MATALRLPGTGTRRGLGALRGASRAFPWLSEATVRKLEGAKTRDEWIDQVAGSTGYSERERDELAEKMFRTKVKAYEDRVTTELRRTGAIGKAQRWRMGSDDHSRKLLWQESERHAGIVANTYDRDRARWATKAKREGGRLNRFQVAKRFDEWNESRAVVKSKQIADTEAMAADMRAGDEMYREAGISDPKRDKFWYWLTTSSGAGGIVRTTRARGGGKGRRSGKTKMASGPCARCRRMQAGNPYTRDALVAAAGKLRATDAKHFIMHPNERCTIVFKPGGQALRSKDVRDKAQKWALRHGTVEGGDTLVPQHPEAVSNARAAVLCPVLSKALNDGWARLESGEWSQSEFEEFSKKAKGGGRYECSRIERVQLGYDAEKVAQHVYGGKRTYRPGDENRRNPPLDLLGAEDGKTGVEVKASHWDADYKGASMKPDAIQRKLDELDERDMDRGKTVCVVMNGPGRPIDVYERAGITPGEITAMKFVRRFEPDQVLWGYREVEEKKGGKVVARRRLKTIRRIEQKDIPR